MSCRAIDLSYKVSGEGPPLLIMHGLLGSSRNWQSIGKALARQRRVFVVDLRNHGQSPWSDEMTYPAMVADILRLLDSQEIHAAGVIGHSMGGKLAMALALSEPSRVTSLAVLDIAPVAYAHEFDSIIDAMLKVPLAKLAKRKQVEAALSAELTDAGLAAFLAQNVADEGGELRWRINLRSLASNMPQITGWPGELDARQYAGHALFLRGARSDYVRAEHQHKISRLFPGAVIETLPDAGHWIHADAPAATLAALQAMLQQSG